MREDSTGPRAARLLSAYDAQLRTAAEVQGAIEVARIGPLWLATFAGERGFICYRSLAGADPATLVAAARAHFDSRPVGRVEWKTRGHDHAPGLAEALIAHGFVAQERESIVLGEADGLAVDVRLPPGVTLRQVTEPADVEAMTRMQAEVFGDPYDPAGGAELVRRRAAGEPLELWVAEADGVIVSAGRLEPVPDSDFAGVWGGATRPEWRHRGIYRALTAARARSALAGGKRYLHSDSTEFSRPILERSGMITVSTTTPYEWAREEPQRASTISE